VNIRTYQSGDELSQAAIFNVAAFTLPGFKPAQAEEVRKRTRVRGFDPTSRFYAMDGGQVVGYCTLEPDQGRISHPWCKKGCEAAAPLLFEAAIASAKERGISKLFAAYRRDWDPVLQFFADNGFAKTRDMVNYWADPVDLPTIANRSGLPLSRLKREDIPALAELGKGIIRLPADKLEQYYFSNPYFPVEAMLVMRDREGEPVAVAIGLEVATWADVKKVDTLAPCFRMGAFGTEGLNAKRVNGLFSLVAKPEHTISAGLGLLSEATLEMTEGTVSAMAAQCPSDVPHLLNFYTRYFKEQGRFPMLERTL
jgi:GNAT superfamily N-acetyltransferase